MLSSSRTRGPRCAALKYHSLKNPLNAVQPLWLHSIFFLGFLTVIEVGRLCPGSVSYEAFNGAIGAKPWLGVGGLPKSSPGCQGRDGIRSLGMPLPPPGPHPCAGGQGSQGRARGEWGLGPCARQTLAPAGRGRTGVCASADPARRLRSGKTFLDMSSFVCPRMAVIAI